MALDLNVGIVVPLIGFQ